MVKTGLFGRIGERFWDEFTCELCGQFFERRYRNQGKHDVRPSDSPNWRDNFIGLKVGSCCFGRVEEGVRLRAPDWVRYMLDQPGQQSKQWSISSSRLCSLMAAVGLALD